MEEGCDPVNRVFYCDLEALPGGLAGVTGLLPVVKLIDNFEAQYSYIANDGTSFVFQASVLTGIIWKNLTSDFSALSGARSSTCDRMSLVPVSCRLINEERAPNPAPLPIALY